MFATCQKLSFWQVCWLVVLVTCQNLASMLVGPAGYLLKYEIWQVCSLVVFVITRQNLILASMFVGRVCTCQNLILASMFVGRVSYYLLKLAFWQVCCLVLFVCLSVFLFVWIFYKTSRTTQSIINKLGHKKALVHDSSKFVGQECRSNNQVMSSKSRSNVESVITLYIL